MFFVLLLLIMLKVGGRIKRKTAKEITIDDKGKGSVVVSNYILTLVFIYFSSCVILILFLLRLSSI